jgi:integrase
MSAQQPSATLHVREYCGQPFYDAMFRHGGVLVKRRIGPAWLQKDRATGRWNRRRSGRVPDGSYDERGATIRAAEVVTAYVADAREQERVERERRSRGVTFRELAHEYLHWLEDVKRAKPGTLRDHGYMLREPGIAYNSRGALSVGHVMAALGDHPASKITIRDIEVLLARISATGASPRTVNKYRSVIAAAFSYACRPSTFALPANPARYADKREEPHRGALLFYTPEEVEAIARAFEDGRHRGETPQAAGEREHAVAEDHRDAQLIRLAAYADLRQGELLALRWSDVDFAGSAITVARAMSAGVESTTKSGRVRRVPLADQAAVALDRLSRREHFTSPQDLVFCNVLGRALDDSALRKRYRRAQAAARVRPLRFHDLRHTFGSLLAADGVDVVAIKAAMGHSALATTSIYLHARPAAEQAHAFTHAFRSSPPKGESESAHAGRVAS